MCFRNDVHPHCGEQSQVPPPQPEGSQATPEGFRDRRGCWRKPTRNGCSPGLYVAMKRSATRVKVPGQDQTLIGSQQRSAELSKVEPALGAEARVR